MDLLIALLSSAGAGVILVLFIFKFLDKFYFRKIGPGPQPTHRHPENLRRRRREPVKEFDTMEIIRIPGKLLEKDKEQTVVISTAPSAMAELRAEKSELLDKFLLG